MLRVGLTGGIGAGKSTALGLLERHGAAVLSTDEVVHELYEHDDVRDAVVERFGEQVAPDGAVDRGALAERAFASQEDRAWLEALLWPLVGARLAEWHQQMRSRQPLPAALVVEIPLLFEAGMDDVFDATIAVIASDEIAHDRAVARGHRALAQRGERQLSQADKAARADYVVVNDGELEQLEAELSELLGKLSAEP